MKDFANFLKSEREKRALTQPQMAEKLDMSIAWYKQLELGNARPGVTAISMIAKVTRRSTKFIYKLINEEEN